MKFLHVFYIPVQTNFSSNAPHFLRANPHRAASGKRQTSKVPLDAWVDTSIDFVLAAAAAAAADADARCGQTLTVTSNAHIYKFLKKIAMTLSILTFHNNYSFAKHSYDLNLV